MVKAPKKPDPSSQFKGELATKIPKPVQSGGLLGENEPIEKYLLRERIRKLAPLLKHYGLDEDTESVELILAFRLASDFVPGFQIENKARVGRPPTSIDENARLYRTVTDVMDQKGCSQIEACKIVKKMHEYKRFGTAKSLETAYLKQKRLNEWAKRIEEGRRSLFGIPGVAPVPGGLLGRIDEAKPKKDD